MRRKAVLALTTLATLGLTPAAQATPAAASSTAPGTLLTARPMTALALPGVPLPAQAWRITYVSTAVDGQPDVVSGTVLVPRTAAANRPLVGFAPGSQGLADRCAASKQLAAGTEYEAAGIAQLLVRGFAVAVTDYPGLGTAGVHPYVMGRTLGPAVLDSMRAARQLRAAHLPAHGPVAVEGYSEGGGAAGWAAQLQPNYAPDLPLAGAAVGGVVADLHALATYIDGGATAFLLPYTLIGMQAAYPDLHVEQYLNAAGRAAIARLKKSCIEDASLDYLPYTPTSSVTTTDLLKLPAIVRIEKDESLGASAPQTPVLMQHSRTDEILSYAQARALRTKWCAAGGHVRFRTELAPDHLSGGVEAEPIAAQWLADRFAGKPATGLC